MIDRDYLNSLSDEDLRAIYSLITSVFRYRFVKKVNYHKNSITNTLASMNINDFLYFEYKQQSSIHRAARHARLRSGLENAKWKTIKTSKGLKVTRIS